MVANTDINLFCKDKLFLSILSYFEHHFKISIPAHGIMDKLIIQDLKIASEMPVPHSLGKYFQHHEIQKYCTSTNFRILSEHCQLYKGPNNV